MLPCDKSISCNVQIKQEKLNSYTYNVIVKIRKYTFGIIYQQLAIHLNEWKTIHTSITVLAELQDRSTG